MSTQPQRNGFGEFIFFALVSLTLIVALWFLFRYWIVLIGLYCSWWMFSIYEHLPWLMSASELKTIIAAKASIPKMNPENYGINTVFQLMEFHGYVWRWLLVPLMVWMGWRTQRGVVRFKYKRDIKNVYDLIEIQRHHFPASAIIYKKDLLNKHPYVGPWATYALPLDFALDHGLLWTSKDEPSPDEPVDEASMACIPPLTPNQKLEPFPVKRTMMPSGRYVAYHIRRANAVFAAQLGKPWKGADALPPLEKALYAVFCTQLAGKQGEAWKMIEQLAFSFKEGERDSKGRLVSPHYADVRGVDELLKKYGNTPAAREIQAKHYHASNVLFATLSRARKKGRLMHANFLWLRPVNNTLWWHLQGEGGQSAYWEAAGPWAHLQIENLMGKRIPVPMVAAAVEALRDTMSREHWIDPGDYSEEAQQRLVHEANKTLEEGRQKAKGGNPSLFGNGFGAPPPNKSTKKRTEDDEP